MKKIIAIVLLVVLSIVGCSALVACSDTEKTLQVYTNAGFAPFEYVDANGKVVGVDIDIMNYIGKELGYKVVINDIEFDQILKEVQGNKNAVGAAGMSKKAERDEVALASDVYATSTQYVIAPNGAFADGAVVSQQQIIDYAAKIGAQKGTTGEDMISGYIKEAKASNEVIEYSNAIVASQDIGKTIKAVIIDELPAKAISEADKNLSCWKIDAEPETYVLYFNKDAGDLVKKVNEILAKMKADGTIDKYIVNHSSGK
jgi:polar amino acid transport system substrate-binding protein